MRSDQKDNFKVISQTLNVLSTGHIKKVILSFIVMLYEAAELVKLVTKIQCEK